MSMTRRWSLLTAVLIVGILAASWFLLVSPKRSDASALSAKATKQQASNDALVQQLNELKAQSLDLPKQKAKLAVMRKQIPDNPALPTLIRDLTAAGKRVGVTVVSMKPGPPVAAAVTVPVAAPVAPAGGTDATATDTTATTDTTSTTANGATPTAAAPVAAPLYLVPLQLDITGSYFEVEQFINKLEGIQRTFLVTGFTLKPGSSVSTTTTTTTTTTGTTDGLTLSLTGQVFLAPNVASTTSTPAAAPVAAQAP
jgi:Tfp pilus assembly protein PilO